MARLEEKIDAREFFRTADSFLYSIRIIRARPTGQWVPAFKAMVVCSAFAIEAYLKVLAQLEKGAPPLHGHSLKDLFGDLSAKNYRRVAKAWAAGHKKIYANYLRNREYVPEWAAIPAEFGQALKACSVAFMDWRYGASDVPRGWHLDGVAEELRKIILEIAPEFAHPIDPSTLDPHSILAKAHDEYERAGPATGWAILDYEGTGFRGKVRRSPDPEDGSAG